MVRHTSDSTHQSINLRVLTLNVWNTSGPPERQQQLRDAIRGLDADLISLQEVVKSDGSDQLDFLLGDSGLHLVHDSDLIDGPTWGTAAAARWSPSRIEGQRLTAHPLGPTVIALSVPLPIGEELLFLAVKPSYKFTEEAVRCRQAVEISALERRLRRAAPTVIAGDFDAAPDHECMRFYTGRAPLNGQSIHFRDAWEIAGSAEPGFTWSTDNSWVAPAADTGWIQVPHHRRIDYVLIGSPEDHARVISHVSSCAVVFDAEPAPSDHYGVIADLALRRTT